MELYRLSKNVYANSLDGKGAALIGGRWNSIGLPVIYTSEHRSLAILEYRVNNPLPSKELIMLSVEAPEEHLITIELSELPKNSKNYGFENPLTAIGDKWLRSSENLLL